MMSKDKVETRERSE